MNIKDLEELEKKFIIETSFGKGYLFDGVDEIKNWVIQDRINTIKQVLEMLPKKETGRKLSAEEKLMSAVFGKKVWSDKEAAAYNQCRDELKSKLNKLIE